jgi:F-type H+-transporting ATPase subunit c
MEMEMELFSVGLVATLTTLGKSIGFGLAVGLAAFGTALGVGLIFASMIQSAARQPEARGELQPIMWLGFALTEAVVFYGLIGALLLVFLI